MFYIEKYDKHKGVLDMNIAETRRTQAIALDLAAELNETAERLSDAAMKANVNGEELFDFVFRVVNELREKLSAEFTESRTTGYEVNE